MKENSKQISRLNISRMLRYAAAALSAVSFLTTLNGINGIVTDSVWIAGLISFGVQAIILVMGLWFIPAVKTIWDQKINVLLRNVVIIFLIPLYLCATAFSSFFSYVYMSNTAYDGLRSTDYNMGLELFLVDNTRTLRNYNDAVYDVLLRTIRQTAPKFRTLTEDYRQTASEEIKQIIGRISKYEVATIPTEMRFTAEGAVTAYEGPNRRLADERLVEDCQRLEQDINQYITYYDNHYYPMYSRCYDDLMGQTNTVQVWARKAEIENVISNMESQIELLGGYGHIYGSVTEYIKSKCNGIIAQYNFLINALNVLENGYDEILSHPDVIQGEGLTLQNFYELVYSADIATQEEMDNARSDLQRVVSAYIEDSDEINEESISDLVKCIECLDKLNQCKELRDRIEQFEANNLTKTYIIVPNNSVKKEIDSVQNTPVSKGTAQLEESAWNATRHADVTEFISLVKSLPDINQVLRQDLDEDDLSMKFLRRMEQENYVSLTLMDAYKQSRAKLENISELERAWDYLYSENNFLAIFCLCIAVFLDVAAFLIGLYMYTCHDTTVKETKRGVDTKVSKNE